MSFKVMYYNDTYKYCVMESISLLFSTLYITIMETQIDVIIWIFDMISTIYIKQLKVINNNILAIKYFVI